MIRQKFFKLVKKKGGEHYTKRFTVWVHLIVMLYAVIKRFDSLREITTSLLADTNKLAHIGITFKIGIFEAIYRDLYARYKGELISDSHSPLQAKERAWIVQTKAPPLAGEGTLRMSNVCDANAKQALVATKGGLSPPRSVLEHQALSPQRSVQLH